MGELRIDRESMREVVGGEFHPAYGFHWQQIEYFEFDETTHHWHPFRKDGVAFHPSPSIILFVVRKQTTLHGEEMIDHEVTYDLLPINARAQVHRALDEADKMLLEAACHNVPFSLESARSEIEKARIALVAEEAKGGA